MGHYLCVDRVDGDFAYGPVRLARPGSISITGALVRQFIALDVTGAVRSWLDNTIPNNGLAINATGLNFYVPSVARRATASRFSISH